MYIPQKVNKQPMPIRTERLLWKLPL